MENKTGIELIAQERKEQIEKHKHTVLGDHQYFYDGQLREAACQILTEDAFCIPDNWPVEQFIKMRGKSYKERLIIAGALIAAEIDRLNFIEDGK